MSSFAITLACLATQTDALATGLRRTPYAGWNPYNHWGCGADEQVVRTQAEALVSLGLRDVGWNFVNLDCGWAAANRGPQGELLPDPRKFPNGILPLAEWVHGLNMSFGIYTDIGPKTCGGGAGILGHEQSDAATFARWGVDLVKNDNVTAGYEASWAALSAVGRPILHSVKRSLNITVAPRFATSRRVSEDITWLWFRVMALVYQQQSFGDNLTAVAGPDSGPLGQGGYFNDMDLLEIGTAGVGPGEGQWQNLSFSESRTHFALWILLKSPMLLSCDLTLQTPATLAMLRNREAMAIHQDPLGIQGSLVSSENITHSEPSLPYLIMRDCNASNPDQAGWSMAPTDSATVDGGGGFTTVRAPGGCLTALHPLYQTAVIPCNATDPRQLWVYNATAGSLGAAVSYGAVHGACLVTQFAHSIRGSFVAVGACRSIGGRWAVNGGLFGTEPPPGGGGGDQVKQGMEPALGSCVTRMGATPVETALGIGQLQVYATRLAGGAIAVGLTNVDPVAAHPITVEWGALGLPPSDKMVVRDVWGQVDIGVFTERTVLVVSPHDTALIHLSPAGAGGRQHSAHTTSF